MAGSSGAPETVLTGEASAVATLTGFAGGAVPSDDVVVTGEAFGGSAILTSATGLGCAAGASDADDCFPGAGAGVEGAGEDACGGAAGNAGSGAPAAADDGASAAGAPGRPSGSPVAEEAADVSDAGGVPPTVLTMLESGFSEPTCGRTLASFSIA